MRRRSIHILVLLLALITAFPVAAQTGPAPEGATGRAERDAVTASRHIVAAANPHAARAAREVLRAGGSAVDAAIAAQLVLNLVEPQSSGIGGGAFLLYWDAEAAAVQAYDGRETAPMAAAADMFLRPDGRPMPFMEAVNSGRSVGVPGLLRMLHLAHERHGRLPWARLFEPAIRLAEEGFPVSPRLHALIARDVALWQREASLAYFYLPDGRPLPEGYILRNPEFAATLRLIAAEGPDAFYRGAIAQDIVAAVQGDIHHPGLMTLDDLGAYRAHRRAPVCAAYRGARVCGMGPPSSGGLTVLQILGMVERFPLGDWPPNGARGTHVLVEASRLAFADRNRYIADSDFVSVPDGMLNRGYLAGRSRLIDPGRAMEHALPGRPPGERGALPGADASHERPGTTHLSIVDRWGDAVSMTSSIENAFGSRIMVRGFLLNNQLTDFSFRPRDERGRAIANRVEGGKRPRSSMAPTLVFGRDGGLLLVTGSPGGSRIIGYVAQSVVAVLDWGLDAQQAASLPHVLSRNFGAELEAHPDLDSLAEDLRAKGHWVRRDEMTSGLHIIHRPRPGLLVGGADPRREGIVLGD